MPRRPRSTKATLDPDPWNAATTNPPTLPPVVQPINAAQRVYNTLEIRRLILESLPRTQLLQLLTLDKASFGSVVEALYQGFPYAVAKDFKVKGDRSALYRDAVRTVSCEPQLYSRHRRKKLPAELDEKIVTALAKRFPLLREVYHTTTPRYDRLDPHLIDCTRVALRGDGTGTITVRKTVSASWFWDVNLPPIDLITPWRGMTVSSHVRLSVQNYSHSQTSRENLRAYTWLAGDLSPAIRYLDLANAPITLEDLVQVCEKREKRKADVKAPLEELRASNATTFDMASLESLLRVLGSSVETLCLAWRASVRPSLLHLPGIVELIREHCPRLKTFHITMSGLGHDGRVVTEQDLRLCTETYDGPLDEVSLTVGDVTAFQLPGLAIGRILPCLGKHTTSYSVRTQVRDSTTSYSFHTQESDYKTPRHEMTEGFISQSDARISRLRHVNFAELDIINVQQYRNIQFGPDGSLVRPPRDDVQHRWNEVVTAVDELQSLTRRLEKHLPALKDKAKEAVSRHVPQPDDFQVRRLIAQLRSSLAAHGPAVEAARELRDRLTSFIDAEDDLKDTLVEMEKRRQALANGRGAGNGERGEEGQS